MWCAVLVLVCASAYAQDTPGPQNAKAPTEDPVVRTPSGVIRGSWMETRQGRKFQAFRGIRYAEPPVGELRFQPPKPILQYKEEVDASQEGPACPLPVPPTYYVDEDCLRINVYTPTTNSTCPMPVIFFIHAGGFYSMTGRSDLAGPHYMMDRDVVFVAINYRIGSLGFMSTGDEHAPGNNGMKDQVAALRWVQRNIAAFGGDPNLVTIAGCSAGSFSVMLHMISPMAKGLFHRGISMSGSPIGLEPTLTHQRNLAVKQAEILNCPTNSSKAIVDCLKTKSWREIGDSLPKFFTPGGPIGMWKPVVEPDFGQERYLAVDPADAIREGKMHTVPLIISQTTDEFYWKAFEVIKNDTLLTQMNAEWDTLAPINFQLPSEGTATATKANRLREVYLEKPLANDDASARDLGNIYSDAIIGFPVHRMAKLMSCYSRHPVYFYEFAYVGNNSHYEDPDTQKPLGAAHHDDLIYLFTLSYRFPTIPLTSPDNKIVETMLGLFENFARYGDPNPVGNVSWPAMTPSSRQYLRIDKELSVRTNLFEDRFKVWEELYPLWAKGHK